MIQGIGLAESVLAHAGDDDHMGGWGGGWMPLWGILMMVVFVAVVGLIVWLILRSVGPGSAGSRTDSAFRAREILTERYARGEISTEEYQERLDQLT